ncbi:hypothetical protein [Paenarthrobacter ureafaciens]|nr:hypothetical protein [Paenarthrobacter ureafaciens]AOY74125.1 hypothetical protein ARZXY2_4626 [Arthrobacter sp. ZXY-2]GLU61075.1 hypothetical protein Pure01_35880 [Paenarthrobacter ureafaciens]GLU65344.1 hypothetical protein Pure02_35940 [Paenarthrobacter ureafaciens]GLU69731.1 hypothetical protein Pure03_37070 [Paenarthrobacter ureafaciens]GLU73952.1 hypothetical protein Pure04_36670 [Paenarthrobacter ureafaciens]
MKPNEEVEGRGAWPAPVPPSTPGAPAKTLREQARELIDELLADTTAGTERSRKQLEACISRNPGRPEAALLEHLMNRTPAPGHEQPHT